MRALIGAFGLAVAAVLVGTAIQDPTLVTNPPEHFSMRVVASGLEGPWELTWGPDEQLWATERKGRRVIRINPADGTRSTLLTVHEVHQSVQQDGLLGLALHPDFLRGSDDVFLVFTYDDAPGPALARRLAIRKYHYNQATRTLGNPEDVITGLPTHDDHVGGRLAIGPDRKLYLTIGDQGSNFGSNRCNANHAQDLPTADQVKAKDWSNYQGKILRINFDGSIPADNPEINGVRSHVFSYGHRNPLGLVFGPNGFLYESEHGPSTDDEVNLIEGGRNYGWPNVAGYRDDKSYRVRKLVGGEGPSLSRSASRQCCAGVGSHSERVGMERSSVRASASYVLYGRDRLRHPWHWQRDDRSRGNRYLHIERHSRLAQFAAGAQPDQGRCLSSEALRRRSFGGGSASRDVSNSESISRYRPESGRTDHLSGDRS